SRKGLIGTDFSDYFTEPDKARAGYQQVFKEGFVTDYPLTIRHKDGGLTDVLYNASIYKDIQGQVLGVFAAARDVTDRKKAEIELDKYRRHLEELVRERTHDLEAANSNLHVEIAERKQAEEALEKAKDDLELRVRERTADLTKANVELTKARDRAEAAVEAKAAFLANMSHELRTPMNAVIGFSNLLLEEDLTPDQKDSLERINAAGEVLLALINDILDFSKMEKKKMELEHQPLSPWALAEEAMSMVAVLARDKGLSLSVTTSYDMPDAIIGDSGRLRQILVNLLSNAVKFTDAGEIVVSISAKALGENKHQILFAVRDTGIGIPKDKMDLLFLPFSQVEVTISSQRGGTGLGLAISKRLAELMGGSIWAESTPGEGSIFYFTFNAEAAKDSLINSRKTAKTISENLGEKKPMRILVAEDNPSNQKVLIEMLKRLGYRADMAADGLEVLQSLERQHYDLVFMDVKMPEMDGITATKEIHRRWPENSPKIIAITAYALDGDREKCIEAGMDDYIAKPVQMMDLAEMMKRCSLEAQ
ncbi:MAG TPA: ATP-binding protein, partial [Methanotrichaceae archaeon]|nr:ATP-binding protein [Methanotrichaceae archaeon]